jgi:hypothetical protein
MSIFETVHYAARGVRWSRSGKALLVHLDRGGSFWIPVSQIMDDSEVRSPAQSGNLVVSLWWAEKYGL